MNASVHPSRPAVFRHRDATATLGPCRARSRSRRRLAALGLALQHIVDDLPHHVGFEPADAHRVTTVLTHQLELVIGADDPIRRCRDVLVDPDRVAHPDGRTARELLGPAWHDVARSAQTAADSTLAYARVHGDLAVLALAARYGASDRFPWWGTRRWDTCVDQFVHRDGRRPALEALLRTQPEDVDLLTLSRVLSFAA